MILDELLSLFLFVIDVAKNGGLHIVKDVVWALHCLSACCNMVLLVENLDSILKSLRNDLAE